MKQILRKAIALILAVTAVLFPLAQMATLIRTTDSAKLASSIETADTNSVVIKAAIKKHYDGDGWNFEPRTSDGVHITPQGDGMHLKGHPDEAFFVFEKTAALEFTAEFDAGWTYNSKYSYFFGNDSEAAEVKKLADGSVKFTYRVKKGAKIAVTELTAACVNATADALPRLDISIDCDFESVTKDEWVNAKISLQLGTKTFASGNYNGSGKVKGRGNSSWGYDKKPYSIKLDEKASLLDIPKTKKYAIVASYTDSTLMRNYITYKAYQDLIGIDYVPKCEFVDVYLNGKYNGIYILVERISIEKNKINIAEADEDNITGGYLIEKNVHGRVNYKKDQVFDCPYQANQVKDHFVLWDFDLAYGIVNWSNADEDRNDATDCPGSGTYEDFMIINSSCPWIKKLYQQDEFRELLTERYTCYRTTVIAELQALIPEQAAYLAKAEDANNKLWKKNFSLGVANLQTWLNGRLEWLDEVWLIEN